MENAFKRIFTGRSHSTLIQFFRYGFVSFFALAVDFGGLVALKHYGHINYLLAATISFTVGLLVSYILSSLWVFHSSKIDSRWHEFGFFCAIGLVGLGLTDLILWGLTSGLHIYYILSKAIATVIVYFWNFGIRKKYLYH